MLFEVIVFRRRKRYLLYHFIMVVVLVNEDFSLQKTWANYKALVF